jgi:hypothetical protein
MIVMFRSPVYLNRGDPRFRELAEDEPCLNPHLVEASLVSAFMAFLEARKPAVSFVMSEHKQIWIDGGGMIQMGELRVYVTIDGAEYGCFARQLPYLLDTLVGLGPSTQIPGALRSFGGWVHSYVITPETRNVLVREFTAQMAVVHRQSQDTARSLDEAKRRAGVIDLPRSQNI